MAGCSLGAAAAAPAVHTSIPLSCQLLALVHSTRLIMSTRSAARAHKRRQCVQTQPGAQPYLGQGLQATHV